MTVSYSFKAVEEKWQKKWILDQKCSSVAPVKDDGREDRKYYVLEMLPYPSGKLHMGHVRNYTIGDIIARFKRMQGYNVLHPMGWDAFGLPAENAAFQNKQHPAKWTYANIAQMREQIKSLGFSYDWDREIATCDLDYYKHEQQLFVEMYKAGLIYQKESWVNWDPVESSVLANEQVVDGRGWRSGAVVEKKLMRQWFARITAYADELLESLKTLQKGWPDKVIKMQENWIGKSQGATIHFLISGESNVISVFTSRPETIFGAAFVAVAANHPLLETRKDPDLNRFIHECQQISTTEEAISTVKKKGYKLDLTVIHPFTGETLPVYVANFIVMDYGTGAIFGCPAHDERDHDFAKKYDLPIISVIDDQDKMIASDFLTGMSVEEAQCAVINRLQEEEKGERTIQFRLRDWGISRQRYWGCPVPMVHCPSCGLVPETRLPVVLPDDVTFDKPGNPLDHHPTWKNTTCPTCGQKAQRETDTLDTFFESSWYWLRYCCPKANTPLDKTEVNRWNPVDWYIGGIEHAVMHLLYARFFTKVLRDLGYLNFDEPFTNLLTQGMVCHKTYKDADGQWLYPDEVDLPNTKIPITIGRSEKMSKSKKNTVDPQEIIDKYGADTTRLFVVSDTPPDKDLEWSDEGLDGCWRYTNRIHRISELLQSVNKKKEGSDELRGIAHKYLQLIMQDYEQHAFNKAIAHHRELANAIEKQYDKASFETCHDVYRIYVLTIAPIMPHLAAELVGKDDELWPEFNSSYLTDQKDTIVVQINGKKRAVFEMVKNASETDLVERAQQEAASYLTGKIQKTIVIPGRMVSFVL